MIPVDNSRLEATVQSELTLRQLQAMRRLDGLPMEDLPVSVEVPVVPDLASPVAGVPAREVCEVACATDLDGEVEALKAELEALKAEAESQRTSQPSQASPPKVFADKAVPCSEDEAEDIPPEVPILALEDKDGLLVVQGLVQDQAFTALEISVPVWSAGIVFFSCSRTNMLSH